MATDELFDRFHKLFYRQQAQIDQLRAEVTVLRSVLVVKNVCAERELLAHLHRQRFLQALRLSPISFDLQLKDVLQLEIVSSNVIKYLRPTTARRLFETSVAFERVARTLAKQCRPREIYFFREGAMVVRWTPESGNWTPLFTQYRHRCDAAAGIAGKIYLHSSYHMFSGDFHELRTRIECFDPDSEQWDAGPAVEGCRRCYLAGATCQGGFYLCGGWEIIPHHDNQVVNSVNFYDPVRSRLEPVVAMQEGRWCGIAAASGGRLFVLGGKGRRFDDLCTAEVFDPRTARWKSLPPMAAVEGGYFAAAVVNGAIYVYGDRSFARFDTLSWVWSELRRQPRAAYGPSASVAMVAFSEKLFVFGGQYCPEVDCFDPVTESWETLARPVSIDLGGDSHSLATAIV
eukprot:TRINITY_DN71244_c0_g1_i1.p1 TRINITY_DN71244_c0_g1~~TRINITY_DN71244_c0_g1_i1.p1  ORF type:complete len:413 (-),score=82.90 TRINITY_DN71244_c0_g1_i1:510-1712(-)